MTELPQQLQEENFRFVLIQPKEKRPFEKGWTKTANYKYNDERLIQHLSNNGNYGVLTGHNNLIVIDADNELVCKIVEEKLPKTFTVRTGSGGMHYYYIAKLKKKIILQDQNTHKHLGEIQTNGQQVVGANSIHPNGNKYQIINDAEIPQITNKNILEALKNYCIEKNKKTNKQKDYKENPETTHIKKEIKISDIMKEYGFDTTQNPTKCLWHEMKGNGNFSFDDENGLWNCFHCKKGGDVFNLVMEHEGVSFKEAFDKLKIRLEGNDEGNINKPEIEIPKAGKLVSKFAQEITDVLKPTKKIFYRPDAKNFVEIDKIKLTDNSEEKYLGFREINPSRFITLIENYIKPMSLILQRQQDGATEWVLKEKSITAQLSNAILNSEILQDLPKIMRIFTVPIPIIYNGQLTFPKRGYDKRFHSWLHYDTPEISNSNISLEKAKELIDGIFAEFCFKKEEGEEKQEEENINKINAIAGLLTPFLRGLFSFFNTRTPVFFYVGNRERTGKDYCAGITSIIYEGMALEDPPISTSDKYTCSNEELRKKILSAFISGRKRMHFSNNKGFINNATFENIATSKVFNDRRLGKNENLTFDNEMDFSLSGNAGITYTPDFANRCRFINLFLDIENANDRTFENPNLHEWVLENRNKILSALYCLVKNWFENGQKKGSLAFASFPEWAKICGGIMECAGYKNPCTPQKESFNIGGDLETENMKMLFEMVYETFGENNIAYLQIRALAEGKIPNKKNNVFDVPKDDTEENQTKDNESKPTAQETVKKSEFETNETELFPYLDFTTNSGKTRFGIILSKFEGRILSNIRMICIKRQKIKSRNVYQFKKC